MIKPILITLGLFALGSTVKAQLTNGLVAHWRMNGNASDASGNGLNGVMSNVTPAAGKYGVVNTAMRFAGDTGSYITIPYDSDMDISSYSICAVIKPEKFYTADCQVNQVFMRADNFLPSHYSLFFTDNAYDSSCTVTGDTTRFNFYAGANSSDVNGGVAFQVYNKPWQYTPAIHTGQWYCVVATFAGKTFKLYVDGVLKVTSVAGSNIPLVPGSQGITIGNNVWDKLGHPYSFKGVIDDMRLYNRVLSDTEVTAYYNIVDTPVTQSIIAVDRIGDLTMVPNPGNGNFVLNGYINDEHVTIEVLNAVGTSVYREKVRLNNKILNKEIRLNDALTSGLYLVRVIADKDAKVLKLNLQR